MQIFYLFLVVLTCCFKFDAAYAEHSSFATVSSKFSLDPNTPVLELSNMPRARDQGPLGICFAMSSRAIVQRMYCQRQKLDCKNLSKKQELSPLAMVAWGISSDHSAVSEGANHSNLTFFEGGGGLNALGQAIDSNRAVGFFGAAESCYPYDQFVSKYGRDSVDVKAIFGDLEQFFNIYRAIAVTGAAYCEDCAMSEFKTHFQEKLFLSPTIQILTKAFKQSDTFPKFLYRITLRGCDDDIEIIRPSPQFESLPGSSLIDGKFDKSPVSYNKVMNKIKELLKEDLPVMAEGFCGGFKDGKCLGEHSLVVYGYKKMCKYDGSCLELLKVQNSYGEQWQKEHDDGWIDAKTLLTSDGTRSTQDTGIDISWYRNRLHGIETQY
jgi:hypothetical protein